MHTNKSFIGSLFDLSFSEFVTTQIIKIVYVLLIVASLDDAQLQDMAAIARKAFGRALRIGGGLDPSDLERALEQLTEPNVGSVGMTTR